MPATIPCTISDYKPNVIQKSNILYIWDGSRKVHLKLTPEELVRQFFIHYLVQFKGFPISNIATETGIFVNQKSKRTDIVAYKNVNPVLLIECKSMEITISSRTLQQISNYQSVILAPFLAITNGNLHYFYKKEAEKWIEIFELPNYKEL